MITNRKTEDFEDDRNKWKIYFDIEKSPMGRGDSTILVSFVINREYLKQDLKNLGKLRIIKQGKIFLEN